MDFTTSFLIVIEMIFLSVKSAGSITFQCYVCSYTLTGDPSLDFECADKPWNFTRGQKVVSCQSPKHCVTKTVYQKGYKRIRSIARYCGDPETFACGSSCCHGSTYYDTCQSHCQGDLCNMENEAQRIKIDKPETGANTPSGNQASKGGSFNCYSCAYQITGDPSVNYECVDRPWNFTIGQPVMSCDSSRYCVTKTVYDKGYAKVRSITRHCGTPEIFSCGSNCCQGSLHDDTCQFQCQGDLCNAENEAKRVGSGQPGEHDNGLRSPRDSSCSVTYSALLLVLLNRKGEVCVPVLSSGSRHEMCPGLHGL